MIKGCDKYWWPIEYFFLTGTQAYIILETDSWLEASYTRNLLTFWYN